MIRALIVVTPMLLGGCSVSKMASNALASAMAEGGSAYATDDDIELIGTASPFALKTMESILERTPQHRGLLLALASGFTQYAYAYVQLPADETEIRDVAAAYAMRERAKGLYLRAREYARRGLGTRYRRLDDARAIGVMLEETRIDDAPLLYWLGVSWAAAIALDKQDLDLIADLPLVERVMRRVLELDEGYDAGAVHVFFIAFEISNPAGDGRAETRARAHFERTLELTGQQHAAPLVTYAESVLVASQRRVEFERLLHEALRIDPRERRDWTLANRVAQRRARWLLSRTEYFFSE